MTVLLRVFGALCPTAFGLDFRIVGKLHRRSGLDASKKLLCANGFYMAGDTDNAAYISGLNEGAYMRALARLVRSEDVVYDIGANLGYLALWLATATGARIVGFEPDPRTAARMSLNCRMNPRLDVRTEVMALGNFDGESLLHSAGSGDGAASLGPRSNHPAMQDIQVQVVRLDSYQRSANTDPSWLILDVEGFGGHVVAGAVETIERHRPFVAAEIHSVDEHRAISAGLRGYQIIGEIKNVWGLHVIWAHGASPNCKPLAFRAD